MSIRRFSNQLWSEMIFFINMKCEKMFGLVLFWRVLNFQICRVTTCRTRDKECHISDEGARCRSDVQITLRLFGKLVLLCVITFVKCFRRDIFLRYSWVYFITKIFIKSVIVDARYNDWLPSSCSALALMYFHCNIVELWCKE